MLFEQRQQPRLRHQQQGGGAFSKGIMGARLAIKQGNLAKPVGWLDQGQQRFLAGVTDRTNAHAALDHRIQATGLIAATKQHLTGRELLHLGSRQQRLL